MMNVDPSGEWTLSGVFGAIDSVGSDLLSTFTDAVSGFLDGIEGGPWAAAVGAIYGVIKSSTITVSGGDLPYSYTSSDTSNAGDSTVPSNKSDGETHSGSSSKPIVDVTDKPSWKPANKTKEQWLSENDFTTGDTVETDMVKKEVIDNTGQQVGELHLGQPRYIDGVDTGEVYPDHYHRLKPNGRLNKKHLWFLP